VVRDPNLVKFGTGLRRLREALGLTQDELAESANSTRNYISLIEQGNRNPSTTKILAIAAGLGISPEEFWTIPNHEERQ
jgi:transcriptional regulator with XRE-family HTH domain